VFHREQQSPGRRGKVAAVTRTRSCTLLALFAALAACGTARVQRPAVDRAVVTVIGTSDLHGHVRALPLLGGHLEPLRRERLADGGTMLLVDAGDMFQGTLESNLEEGSSVVDAYAALHYDAAAIGNHEFDFGPIGPRATATQPGDDPRGALLARVAQALFVFLAANVRGKDGAPTGLGVPSLILPRAGINIGVIGVTTEATPFTTIAANLAGLSVTPVAAAIREEAARLRAQGAAMVVVAAHAGGRCTEFANPDDLSSCEDGQEIMQVARALPPGTVDVIVAGHTHQAMAHRVNGIAIVQSYALGVAYGRVDVVVDRRAGKVLSTTIHPPRRLCSVPDASPEGPIAACAPIDDLGRPVTPDPKVERAIAGALERAAALRGRRLGPIVRAPFEPRRRGENPIGNLFADLMLRARPGADAAVINGGGLRAALPAGPLDYGALFEAFPFDNRFARVTMRADQFAAILAAGLGGGEGPFLSIGGLTAAARCEGGALAVTLLRDGRPVGPDETIEVLASDFLATGGDQMFAALREQTPAAVVIEDDPPIREAVADQLRALGRVELAPESYYDPARPRLVTPGPPPVRCVAAP
jgi:2',3'-cyclic-nucleotide 2'-phosphodiesterase (5'-nucleotidase family)